MLDRFAQVLNNLVVYPEQMLKNIYLTNGVIFAQNVMNQLIERGSSREDAYDLVQPIAMDAYNNNKQFKDLLFQNTFITKKMSKKDIEQCFDLKKYFQHVPYIFKKVGIN
jgi:adenylosuccinate lyase